METMGCGLGERAASGIRPIATAGHGSCNPGGVSGWLGGMVAGVMVFRERWDFCYNLFEVKSARSTILDFLLWWQPGKMLSSERKIACLSECLLRLCQHMCYSRSPDQPSIHGAWLALIPDSQILAFFSVYRLYLAPEAIQIQRT